MIKESHIIERTDAFRLLVMYQEGGLYMDMDKVYNKPLTPLIGTETRMLLTTAYDANFMQALMCSPPGNIVFKEAIERQWAIRRGPRGQGLPRVGGWLSSADIMKMGPSIYMNTIMDVAFDSCWPPVGRAMRATLMEMARAARARVSNPTPRRPCPMGGSPRRGASKSAEVPVFAPQAIRRISPTILTYRDVWCDGMLIDPFPACKKVDRAQTYTRYGLNGGWKEATDERWAAAAANRTRRARASLNGGAGHTRGKQHQHRKAPLRHRRGSLRKANLWARPN